MRAALVALGLAGCLPAPGTADEPFADPLPGPPALTTFSVACDPDQGRWELRADTDAWVGTARLWFTGDFTYVERHNVRSSGAAADGTEDHLKLDLNIARDWRAVTQGTNTALGCGAAPDGLFAITAYKDNSFVDCRVFGPEPARWTTVPDAPLCDTLWEPEVPEGTDGSEGTDGTSP